MTKREKNERIVMKRFMFGALLLILVCLTFTLPSVKSDDSQTFTLPYGAWNIHYTISDAHVTPGQAVNLDITLTPNVVVYDFRLQATSTPDSSLVTDNVWRFQEIKAGEQQSHTFVVKIPANEAPGTYNIDLRIQGYNDTAYLEWYPYWSCRGSLCFGETPQYTQDTSTLSGYSIVLIVA